MKKTFLIISGVAIVGAFLLFLFPPTIDYEPPQANVPQKIDIPKVKAAAEKGDTTAQVQLARAYIEGDSVSVDYKLAAEWFDKAAKNGNADGWVGLGELSEIQRDTNAGPKKAIEYYQLAAAKGHATAQYNLGQMYAKGVGVKQDQIEAAKWFMQSATNGDVLAQYNLGMRFLQGRGVKTNKVEAYYWLNRSKAIPEAEKELKKLKSDLSGDQLSEVENRMLTLQKTEH